MAYYEARALEYDDWWLGTGAFADREPPGWDEEREGLIALIAGLRPARTLDVACGTGFFFRPEELAAELGRGETLFAGRWFVAARVR